MPSRISSWFVLAIAVVLLALVPRSSRAFGEEGAFNPRILLSGTARWEGARTTGPSRWSEELVRRTSAPARLIPTTVRADAPALLAEPFVVWAGETDIPPLTSREVAGLKRFIALGGVMFVDDFAPEVGAFGKAAKRELTRVLPDGAPVPVGPENVLFRSFYLLRRPVGRVEASPKLEVIMRGGQPQVIFSSHDLLGALARSPNGTHPFAVIPGGEPGREQAMRLAVNIAMYVLCSNYKDDQVHAPFLMRRRASEAR
ncbi:MAG: DUF4159 domain-containing protein [Polyangiaceae bacterium]|nr:DUF4159 domain-containing protein [Polyangiaceae bacterium]